MGFRGCDEDFARGLEMARQHPDEFRYFIEGIRQGNKERKERIEVNAEKFLEEFGIKYCPFHYRHLVEDVAPNSISLNVDGVDYPFDDAVCSYVKLCKTPVSFDRDLISKVFRENLAMVSKKRRLYGCTTCGGNGDAYFLGFRSPKHHFNSPIKERKEWSNDIPVYLFKGDCGHNYVFMQSFGALDLKLNK